MKTEVDVLRQKLNDLKEDLQKYMVKVGERVVEIKSGSAREKQKMAKTIMSPIDLLLNYQKI